MYLVLLYYTDKENTSKSARSPSRGLQCAYFGCTNRVYTKDGQKTSFHFFPYHCLIPRREHGVTELERWMVEMGLW